MQGICNGCYDANGNTTLSGGNTDSYDFENKLISRNNTQVAITYDGDGNKVHETVGGVTTSYLTDTKNPTGYSQVLEEIRLGQVVRAYAYGTDLISQDQIVGANFVTHFFGYDGHGNVRFLTDQTGAVTDTYDYDAFGILIHRTGSTPNNYLYAGEQNDPNLGLYYNRARYLNAGTGRFWTMDAHEGVGTDPMSLHKYLYTAGNPVNMSDPSGNFGIGEFLTVFAVIDILAQNIVAAENPKSLLTAGPDVTQQLKNVLKSITTSYNALKASDPAAAKALCDAITSGQPDSGNNGQTPIWLNAWDIIELRDIALKGGKNGERAATVTVDGKSFYAGSVNYVMFGLVNKLCGNTQAYMDGLIHLYKGPLSMTLSEDTTIVIREAAGNYGPSVAWADAGFNGWPDNAKTPDGDRPNYAPSTEKYKGDFRWRWLPSFDPQ